MVISPWDGLHLNSPNRELVATLTIPPDSCGEVCQGGPTIGNLHLSNGMCVSDCNSSAVWSSDSRYLAIPRWTRRRKQRLLVIDVERGVFGYALGNYDVLELQTFDNELIEGVDSPTYKPRTVSVSLSSIRWEN